MPPTIHLVRHAEGYHNAADGGESIHDPFLTDEGKRQAQDLCDKFPHHDKIDLLMASPLVRTIQTCQYGFQPAVQRGHQILLMPLAQESSSEPMDTGSSEKVIKDAFGDLVDTQRLSLFPYWYTNEGTFSTEPSALIERARKLRAVLRQREESNIAIVSHGSFAHHIVGNIDDQGRENTRMWSNTECRSYQFISEDDEDAQLRELDESKQRRPDLEKRSSGYIVSNDAVRKGSSGEIKA